MHTSQRSRLSVFTFRFCFTVTFGFNELWKISSGLRRSLWELTFNSGHLLTTLKQHNVCRPSCTCIFQITYLNLKLCWVLDSFRLYSCHQSCSAVCKLVPSNQLSSHFVLIAFLIFSTIYNVWLNGNVKLHKNLILFKVFIFFLFSSI